MYGSPSFSLGSHESIVAAAANAPVTAAQALEAKAELKRMRRSLAEWLKYRSINDRTAAGHALPRPALKRPGARPAPPAVMALRLSSDRAGREAALAAQIHSLLSEVFDSSTLPSPQAPGAAVTLAQIAISGKLPGEAGAPQAAGFSFVWPIVIVVGAVAYVITTKINSDADAAKEHERIECVKSGGCTDSGFWMKVGAAAFLGWLAWDKMGLRERAKTFFAKS